MKIFKKIYVKIFIKNKFKSIDQYFELLKYQYFWAILFNSDTNLISQQHKNTLNHSWFHNARVWEAYKSLDAENFKKKMNELSKEHKKYAKAWYKEFTLRVLNQWAPYYANFNNFFFWELIISSYKTNFNFFNFVKNFKTPFNIKMFLKKTFGQGSFQIFGYLIVMWFDIILTDDEPLLEPIEWSMMQTWILFVFGFAWIAENLITSRYGSYTGKDKRIWSGWYKTFFLIDFWYAINYGIAVVTAIVPYYHELVYSLPLIHSWWNWYNRVFFFKLTAFLVIILGLGYWMQINYRWLNWKKIFIPIIIINLLWSYLLFTQSLILLFGYFTDPFWYQKNFYLNYTRIGMGPWKWQMTLSLKRDPILQHPVKSTFWFKNDSPFGSSFILTHQLILLTMFFIYVYWISLMRRVWSTKEIPLTFMTYCVNAIKHFLYGTFFLYLFVFLSFLINYLRLPPEYLFSLESMSWLTNLKNILCDYPYFIFDLLTMIF